MAIRMPAVWRVTRATASWRANSLGGGQNFGIAVCYHETRRAPMLLSFHDQRTRSAQKKSPATKAGQVLGGNQIS